MECRIAIKSYRPISEQYPELGFQGYCLTPSELGEILILVLLYGPDVLICVGTHQKNQNTSFFELLHNTKLESIFLRAQKELDKILELLMLRG